MVSLCSCQTSHIFLPPRDVEAAPLVDQRAGTSPRGARPAGGPERYLGAGMIGKSADDFGNRISSNLGGSGCEVWGFTSCTWVRTYNKLLSPPAKQGLTNSIRTLSPIRSPPPPPCRTITASGHRRILPPIAGCRPQHWRTLTFRWQWAPPDLNH